MHRKSMRRASPNANLPTRVSERFSRGLLDILSRMDGFAPSYLASEYKTKYLDPKVVDPLTRAKAGAIKWLSAERRNEATNLRLYMAQAIEPDFGWITWPAFVGQVKSLIASVLGPVPKLGELPLQVTNGASTRVRRGNTAARLKLVGEMHVSESALNHLLEYWSDKTMNPEGWKVVNSSTLFTVPKKTEVDRVACKEPEGNMLLQRAVGVYIRKRLRRKAGINLLDQTRNQTLAREGSRDGRLATIDLSSASDTISSQLVCTLMPAEWWSLLDDLRVKSTRIPGEILGEKDFQDHELNMFSSMGNGFTFELETLLFWSIVKVIQRSCSGSLKVVSVYGDDIICDSRLVKRISRMFEFLGFKLNQKKTNYGRNNLFRESCGGHYSGGFDVTPFYLREELSRYTDLIHQLNQLLEWDGRGWGFFQTEELARFHAYWSRSIPQHLWGGVDTSEIGALVTGHSPRKTLVPIERVVALDDKLALGGYRLWHIQADGRGDVQEGTIPDGRGHGEPRDVVGFRLQRHPRKGLGERTSWDPYLIWDPSANTSG